MAKKCKKDKKTAAAASVRDLLGVGPEFDLSAVDARRIVAGPQD